VSSLDRHIGKYGPEEVLDIVEMLREMQQTPGWARYIELLGVHREWLLMQLTQPIGQKDNPSAAHYASVGGTARGIEYATEILLERMEKTAAMAREALAQRNGDH
jgi:hypothetical protein